MNKFQVMSDLHFEFQKDSGIGFVKSIKPAADNLILAGDIFPLVDLKKYVAAFSILCGKYTNVYYVCGNHEYYGSGVHDIPILIDKLTAAIPNLIHLDSTTAKLGDITLFGGTMWFEEDFDSARFARNMSDFSTIKGFVPWVYYANAHFCRCTYSCINDNTIVITHHLPSMKSVDKKFVGSTLNRFFVSNADRIIGVTKPKYWIHGHAHDPCDYTLHGCRVISNPLGYPSENSKFNDSLTIEV